MPSTRPPGRLTPIRTDESNAFAHRTMKVRLPKILDDVLYRNPDLPESVRDSIMTLHDSIASGSALPALVRPAPDLHLWQAEYAAHPTDSWHNTIWFFAETYAYRLVMESVHWYETGLDPFWPYKDEELYSPAMWDWVERALTASEDKPIDERLHNLLAESLWGNRVDLSYAASRAYGNEVHPEDLLIDHREQAIRTLLDANKPVHLVQDNAGTELALDLALIDGLLTAGIPNVILHLKWHPTFVSDTTVADAHIFIKAMRHYSAREPVYMLGKRLTAALESGQLHLAPDLYWNSSLFGRTMPSRIHGAFAEAGLVIMKGDVNFRRLVEDTLWPSDTNPDILFNFFPAPLIAMRALKSDPIIGLQPGEAEALDAADPEWHINGKRGIIVGAHLR